MAVALAILVLNAGRVAAQEAGAARIGLWLVGTLAAYPIDMLIDQVVNAATVRDNEAELTSIQLNLQNLYKKSMARRSSDVQQIKLELDTTTSELKILHSLMRQRPTREDLGRYRAEVDRDVAALKKTVAKHEKLLQQHGRQLQQHEEMLREQGDQITDLQRRMDQQEAVPAGPPLSLTLIIEGASSVVRLHTERWCEVSDAKVGTGTVHVGEPESVVDYCVANGTAAVVEIAAPRVWVSLPASLSDLVEIHDNGRTFQRWVHPDP